MKRDDFNPMLSAVETGEDRQQSPNDSYLGVRRDVWRLPETFNRHFVVIFVGFFAVIKESQVNISKCASAQAGAN